MKVTLETPDEVRVERLTSGEIAQKIAEGARTAVLPLGAIEQHGPHLPLSVDSDHADALAIRIARRLGDALVLPTVRVGYSPYHLDFAGTLSLRASTLEAICLDYCSGLASHGFDRVLIFSGHIGNYPIMRDFELRLSEALRPSLEVLMFRDHNAILEAWRTAAEQAALLGTNVGGHADIAESSIMLALHPERVRVERAASGYRGVVDDAFLRRAYDAGISSVSPNGVLGDPSGMSPAIGKAALALVSTLISDFARSRGTRTQ